MNTRTARIVMVLALIGGGGCTPGAAVALSSFLSTVITVVEDGGQILSSIESFTRGYFAVKPNPDLEKKITDSIARARLALDAALRASQGGRVLTQGEIDTAFSDFRQAYADLLDLARQIGVHEGTGALRAAPGELVVPTPLALTVKAK